MYVYNGQMNRLSGYIDDTKLVQLATWVRNNPDCYKVRTEKDCQEGRNSQVVKKERKK